MVRSTLSTVVGFFSDAWWFRVSLIVQDLKTSNLMSIRVGQECNCKTWHLGILWSIVSAPLAWLFGLKTMCFLVCKTSKRWNWESKNRNRFRKHQQIFEQFGRQRARHSEKMTRKWGAYLIVTDRDSSRTRWKKGDGRRKYQSCHHDSSETCCCTLERRQQELFMKK